jgi:hypothetical protein
MTGAKRSGWTLGALAVVIASALLPVGCQRRIVDTTDAQGTPIPAVAVPADRLAPGELLEGGDQAFGIQLPREIRVEGSFVHVVYARGEGTIAALTKYFTARLSGGEFRQGTESATFDHVRSPAKPGIDLRIVIRVRGTEATIEIRDISLPPAPDLPDEAARWRQVGLTPDGRLADPTHLR